MPHFAEKNLYCARLNRIIRPAKVVEVGKEVETKGVFMSRLKKTCALKRVLNW